MLLLTGPAGSGKTKYVLEQFRESLRSGKDSVRLLVPTATMAQHLQNEMAREGFVFRRSLIQTLSMFIGSMAVEFRQVPDSVLYLIVEEAAQRVNRPEFARVVRMPGFCASLARIIGEFSSAGCDSIRLSTCLPEAPLSEAFLAVYREVDRELRIRKLHLRAQRLAYVADRIRTEGLGGISTIWMDGFHALPDPERDVISAMGERADLTLTFDAPDSRLLALGFEERYLARTRTTPARALVKTPSIEREVEEIASRIVKQAEAGRPFREIGIIVRNQQTYVPLLRASLHRFGIPARFYFDSKLDEHRAIRLLTGAVDAMLNGWDHIQTLSAMRLIPRYADSPEMDRFDFAVRERAPNQGLAELPSPATEQLRSLEEWLPLKLPATAWAARLQSLRTLFAMDAIPVATHEMAIDWRSDTAALKLFDQALTEAAEALAPDRPIALAEYWRGVKSVLRISPLRIEDRRRNAVHVLSAPEARQWVLPVMFVCGMVEKEFPQFHRQDPFFPDHARRELNAAGIRVRTAAEFEHEEKALFQAAISRATLLVTLTYPEFNSRGDRNLPSIFLEDLMLPTEESRAVRPQPRRPFATPPLPEIRTEALLDYLRQRTATLSPSALETYLQCPYQYFGARLMRLKPRPARPQDRLDFLTQGNIVHDVLSRWWIERPNLEALFEETFERFVAEKRIPSGYHTERLRNSMLLDLQMFVAQDKWPRGIFDSRIEEKFAFPLSDSVQISGKMDRLDIAADGTAYVIDYKYSAKARTKDKLTNENLLQAPLYLMAAEKHFGVKPAGMFYVGLKKEIVYAGWTGQQALISIDAQALPENWTENSTARTLQIIENIRDGRIEVNPADTGNCKFCDVRDACRYDFSTVEIDEAEGA